ncbi:MAG: hypothetical protein ACTSUY_05715, partial [Alphaproteobacteria bacterium]
MKKIKFLITPPIVRITLGIASISTLTVLLWPAENWILIPERLMAFVGAAFAWGWCEFIDYRKNLSDVNIGTGHDAKLIRRVRNTVSDENLNFLRHHDLGGSFHSSRLDFLERIQHQFEGARYEFDDSTLQKAFSSFRKRASELRDSFAESCNPTKIRGRVSLVS